MTNPGRIDLRPSPLAKVDLDPMFSPATFYDAMHSEGGSTLTPERLDHPPIVAFYGFKGGAGRTTALAHVGALLAERGARVVALDLDLEAPGLHTVTNVRIPDHFQGTAALLRDAILKPSEELLDVRSSLLPVQLDAAVGGMWVLPAGQLDDEYLATIEELSVSAWHSLPRPQPLQRLITEAISSEINPDVILLDCRTGFQPLSAVALFHVADTAVLFLPISPQVWDGLTMILRGVAAAKRIRNGRPDLLVVPTLVPPDPIGKPLIAQFVQDLEKNIGDLLAESAGGDLAEDPDDEHSWLGAPIEYDTGLASSGRLDINLRGSSWQRFRSLSESIGVVTSLESNALNTTPMNVAQALTELDIESKTAFAEDVQIDDLVDTFVAPGDLARLLDRTNALVVGAKGAGKTWLFRYLVGETQRARPHVIPSMLYVVGHAPASVTEQGPLNLSKDALKEIERACKMASAGTHTAFWRLYGCSAVCNALPRIASLVSEHRDLPKTRTGLLVRARSPEELQGALTSLLVLPDIGTLSARMFRVVDELLLSNNEQVTLVYDGLDTSFDVGSDAYKRQDRFVKGLLQLVLERRDLRRVQLKVFLREDLELRLEMQNKSHLEATKAELRWRPVDLWRIALVRARKSAEYRRFIASLPGGLEDPGVIADDAVLRRLLDPLWGATVQGTRKARTAFYVQKRTSDAVGRLFPRTLIQLLSTAVQNERNSDVAPRDRLLRFPAIRQGVDKASAQRVEDLIAEYKELAPYLRALRGRNPTGTQAQFIKHLKENVERAKPGRKGVEAGWLHAGPRGWSNVIDALRNVGVLGEYKRGGRQEKLLVIALLYRPGLQIRAAS